MGTEQSSDGTSQTAIILSSKQDLQNQTFKTCEQENINETKSSDDSIDDDELADIQKKHREQFRLRMNMKCQEFTNFGNSNTLEDAIENMNKIARCVNNIDIKLAQNQISDGINEKVLFIVVNTYTKPQYQLGVEPMNDAITVALNHKKIGYKILYLHNSTPTIFKKWLKFLLKNTEKELTIFYAGHGCSIRDKNGDESDGYDEVLLFDNGYVIDDELADYLLKYAHGQRIVLLSDCWHNNSMLDIQSRQKTNIKISQNILSISSAKDGQTVKQAKIKAKEQGIFSYYFWELIENNPALTIKEMEVKINPLINNLKQHLTYATTSPKKADEPIPQHRERKFHRRGHRRTEKDE